VQQGADPSDPDRESSSSAEKAQEPEDGENEDHDDDDEQPTYEDAPPDHGAAAGRQPGAIPLTVGWRCKTRWPASDEVGKP
jgi:hypothetical protein